MRILHSNVRGFYSKKETLYKIIVENKIDIVMLNETHAAENKPPTLKGFTTYSRARVGKRMGGVAVLIRDELDHGAVKIEEGEGDNEYLAVKLQSLEPPLVVFSYYGQQEGQHSTGKIQGNVAEVLEKIKLYDEMGFDIVWAGDTNLKVGNRQSGLLHNDEAVSRGGQFLLDRLEEEGNLQIANIKHNGPGLTHVDATSGNSRVLDLVITNCDDKIEKVMIDEDLEFTPYRVRVTRGKEVDDDNKYRRVYSDHRSIITDLKTNTNDEVKRGKKLKTWRYGKPGGRENYYHMTNEAAEELGEIIKEEEDINVVMEKLDQMLINIKDKCYGRCTTTIKKKARVDDNEIWKERIRILENHIQGLEGERISDQVYSTQKKYDKEGRVNQIHAVKDGDGKILR